MDNSSNNKKLKYPILLVHGMGFRDRKLFNYWGRIPKMLKKRGCIVFYGNQDANGTIENNAKQLKRRIEKIKDKTGFEKFHIIAHSKGGLDSRYMISSLDMGEAIVSLTTISTPHHGSKTIDKILKIPKFLLKFFCFFSDIIMWIFGDKRPKTYKAINSFSTKQAEIFNESNIDNLSTYYQSYAFVMKRDLFMWLSNRVIKKIEGENDGLVTPESAKWANFKGIIRSNSKRGISHCDEVDLRRRRFTKKQGDGICDILEVYIRILNDLIDIEV